MMTTLETKMRPEDALRDAQAIVNTMQLLCAEIPQERTITLQAGYLNETLYRICKLLDIAGQQPLVANL